MLAMRFLTNRCQVGVENTLLVFELEFLVKKLKKHGELGKGGGVIFQFLYILLHRKTNDVHLQNFIQIPQITENRIHKCIQIGQNSPTPLLPGF